MVQVRPLKNSIFWRKSTQTLEIFLYSGKSQGLQSFYRFQKAPQLFILALFAQIISQRNIRLLFHQTKAVSTSPTVFRLSRPVNSNSTCQTVKCVSLNGKNGPEVRVQMWKKQHWPQIWGCECRSCEYRAVDVESCECGAVVSWGSDCSGLSILSCKTWSCGIWGCHLKAVFYRP